MTEKTLDAFFSLLKAGLWGTAPDADAFPSLSPEEWGEIMSMSSRQTVTGLVFLGLDTLPEDKMPPLGTLAVLAAKADAVEKRNWKMNAALASLCAYLSEHGITPVLQKGQGIAAMYRCPHMRECGDIDFCFRSPGKMNEADALIREKGLKVSREPDGSSCYVWEGIVVEHHRRLLDLYNPFIRKYLQRLEHEEAFRLYRLPGTTADVFVPSPEVNLLMLYAHVLKHAVGKGIGLRQICDAAVACSGYAESLDRSKFREMCSRTGITGWCGLLHGFMTEYLGLRPDMLPSEAGRMAPDTLLDIVLRGGNFGQYDAGGAAHTRKGFTRKLHTAMAFLRNSRFSLSVAPGEAVAVFFSLLAGQRGLA